MCEEGVQPDDVTFVCLLSACSHAGLVAKGMHCYASMIPVYMVSAKLEHGTCVVNVLGCAGHLKEAENIINVIPHMAPWKALLSGCRILSNLEMGKHDAKWVLEFWSLKMLQVMFCCQTSMLLLATSISVKQQRKERGVKKQQGHTWVKLNNQVHTCVMDNWHHPEIHAELKRLSGLMHENFFRIWHVSYKR